MSILALNVSSATLAIVLGLVMSWILALVAIAMESMEKLITGAFYSKAIMTKSMSKKLVTEQEQ